MTKDIAESLDNPTPVSPKPKGKKGRPRKSPPPPEPPFGNTMPAPVKLSDLPIQGVHEGVQVRALHPPASMGVLPPDHPVKPLGKNGNVSYFAVGGQLRSYTPKELSRNPVSELYSNIVGPKGYGMEILYSTFPRYRKIKMGDEMFKVPTPPRFAAEHATDTLLSAASYAGAWNPMDKERAVGAYPYGADGVILHRGDKLICVTDGDTKTHELGLFNHDGSDYFYTGHEPLPAVPTHKKDNMNWYIGQVFEVIKKWNFANQTDDIAARLVMGWIAQSFICGALKTRGNLWITAPSGHGKTELGALIEIIVGKLLLSGGDITPAGISQTIGRGRNPFKLDDFVNKYKQFGDALSGVLELIKIAHTGDTIRRGGQDGKSTQYSMHSAFLCSTVVIPPQADGEIRSRFIEIRLAKLPETPPDDTPTQLYDPELMATCGGAILQKIITLWGDFAETLTGWESRLLSMGATHRQKSVMGPLLAMGDLVLNGVADGDITAGVTAVLQSEKEKDVDDWRRVLGYIQSYLVGAAYAGGKQYTAGQYLSMAVGDINDSDVAVDDLTKILGGQGMRVELNPDYYPSPVLIIPIKNAGHIRINDAFRGTEWPQGRWMDILTRSPVGFKTPPGVRYTIGGVKYASMLYIPINTILNPEE